MSILYIVDTISPITLFMLLHCNVHPLFSSFRSSLLGSRFCGFSLLFCSSDSSSSNGFTPWLFAPVASLICFSLASHHHLVSQNIDINDNLDSRSTIPPFVIGGNILLLSPFDINGKGVHKDSPYRTTPPIKLHPLSCGILRIGLV